MRINPVRTTDAEFPRILDRLLQRRARTEAQIEKTVSDIIRQVCAKGDRALVAYAKAFDRTVLDPSRIEVSRSEMDQALKEVPAGDRRALAVAATRISRFHRRQLEKSWSYRDPVGLRLGQRITPLERAGVYVPGGKACYPSTVLMTVIPAKVAGVKEVVVTTPIGKKAALMLAAASVAGADRVFRVGGAQAVAALAYGTETIPKVDKIVGPGNVYVAAAKRLVFGQVDIDSIAGPSEVLLIVDASADPAYVAADMLSQAEHDELAAAICVTPSGPVGVQVSAELEKQVRTAKRRSITLRALERFGTIIVTRTLSEAVDIANSVAPEHVQLMVRQPGKWAKRVHHAGAIFIGPYATPPLGDYLAGPNHVLPTGGSARFFSPLGTYDFLKRTSVIRAQKQGLAALAPHVVKLARLEGLDDHARAVEARFNGGARNRGR